MKKQFVWSFIGTCVVMIAALVLVLAACSKKDAPPPLQPVNTGIIKTISGSPVILMAGQNIQVGELIIVDLDNDNDNVADHLQITYSLIEGWRLTQIHFWIGLDQYAYPQVLKGKNKGSPIPGQFPWKFENLSDESYTFVVPIPAGWACELPLFAIAHAAAEQYDIIGGYVTQTQSVYGGDIPLPGSNWAKELSFEIDCLDGPPDVTCISYQYETAFGGSTMGLGKAWWYYFEAATLTQPIYAGKDNITDGTVTYDPVAGTLTIDLGSWELQDVAESVKIQGYDVIPLNRPPAGLFTTYKGVDLIVPVPAYPFYVIHLDVKLCLDE